MSNDNISVIDKRRKMQDALVAGDPALAAMTPAGREAVLAARPPAEFAVQPMATAEELALLKEVIADYKIRMPRGWVLVIQMPRTERIGHILLPEVSQDAPKFGMVVAVSQGTILPSGAIVPPEVQPGNHVSFPSFCGEEIEIAGTKMLRIREDEIMTIAGDAPSQGDPGREA